jgi:beta-glucanase (GH16 family)
VEWTPDKITWKINGVAVASAPGNIANEPMYMVINSAIFDHKAKLGQETPLEVDWVRCYQHSEST